jgi:hypothetical protein
LKSVKIILLILMLSTIGFSQTLPSNFQYKRETGEQTGIPSFSLFANEESIGYDALRGNTFEALGALIQPERDIYGLIFLNAKPKYQLSLQKANGVVLKINGQEIIIPNYSLGFKRRVGRLNIETAIIKIDKSIYEKLIKANDVFISVGIVKYSLDQDNIEALQYFGNEVEKDLKRRKVIK